MLERQVISKRNYVVSLSFSLFVGYGQLSLGERKRKKVSDKLWLLTSPRLKKTSFK